MSSTFQTLKPGIQQVIKNRWRSARPENFSLKFTVTVILVIGSLQHAYTQSQIRGSVQDGNERPVSNATVALVHPIDSAEVSRTTSNAQGVFNFSNVGIGDYIISVTAIGFTQKWSSRYSVITAQDEIDAGMLKLEMKSEQLNEVVIRAKKPLIEQKIDRTIII
jgi:iron complex outermembrane recepter protein